MTKGIEKINVICEKCGKNIRYNIYNSYKIIKLANQNSKILCSFCKMKEMYKRKSKV